MDGRLWADLLAPAFLAILAIAPWSNLLLGHLYGPPTALPWGIAVQNPISPYAAAASNPSGLRFHPTPAYFSLWMLITLVGILWLEQRRGWRPGNLALIAAALGAAGLFLADTLRLDVSRFWLNLSGMQILALGLLVGVGILIQGRNTTPLNRPDPHNTIQSE
jgi:phosphatidylglycerol:prolipoprotein diacylglycerol transferase